MEYSYCADWPVELKNAEFERLRAEYLILSLEAKLTRIEPESSEYWETIERIEKARVELRKLSAECFRLSYIYQNKKIEENKNDKT